ncbi:hypothetical protein NCCP2716_31020 [Sporosarcina sp. NCCP-2716]|uniref:hypothetical protein n=1 Tax=Sporosarcina sp. NCCP-2716 TaxID=2943679 RepID=UPI00203EBA3D|nr:hypothetical protein [Sporosarcina sp. NCCP-2716]GKV70604.1 hypothetical protein NCCP2716_31020 [Sporosarcina sp. NCCP-2716]
MNTYNIFIGLMIILALFAMIILLTYLSGKSSKLTQAISITSIIIFFTLIIIYITFAIFDINSLKSEVFSDKETIIKAISETEPELFNPTSEEITILIQNLTPYTLKSYSTIEQVVKDSLDMDDEKFSNIQKGLDNRKFLDMEKSNASYKFKSIFVHILNTIALLGLYSILLDNYDALKGKNKINKLKKKENDCKYKESKEVENCKFLLKEQINEQAQLIKFYENKLFQTKKKPSNNNIQNGR